MPFNVTTSVSNTFQQKLIDFSKSLSSFTIDEKISEKAKPLFDQIRDQLEGSPIRLKQPRDICTLHKHLMKITEAVKVSPVLKEKWSLCLEELQTKKVLTIGHHLSVIDCSTQFNILSGISLPKISIVALDVSKSTELNKMIDVMSRLDEESLGTCIQPGFYKALLLNPNTLCFYAKTEKNEVVGWLWGSILTIRDLKIFHVWGMARRANLPGLHLTRHFVEAIKPVLKDQRKVDYFTFSVFSENVEAIKIYKELGAHIPENGNEKQFVSQFLGLADHAVNLLPPTKDEVWAEMKKHALGSLGYLYAAYYELYRQVDLLWRKVKYSDCFFAKWL